MTSNMFVVDCDNHYIETKDSFTRYIAEEYKVNTVTFENGPRNQNYVVINRKRCVLMPAYNPPLDSDAGTADFMAALEEGKLDEAVAQHRASGGGRPGGGRYGGPDARGQPRPRSGPAARWLARWRCASWTAPSPPSAPPAAPGRS